MVRDGFSEEEHLAKESIADRFIIHLHMMGATLWSRDGSRVVGHRDEKPGIVAKDGGHVVGHRDAECCLLVEIWGSAGGRGMKGL